MRELLVVVDYQNDFVDGALGFEGAEKLDKNIVKRIEDYKDRGKDILFLMDSHGDDYLETMEGKNLPVKHCIKGTKGWEFYGETGKLMRSLVDEGRSELIYKTGFSADPRDIDGYRNYDKVEIAGLVTNMCVIANAIMFKTLNQEAEILVDSKLTDSFDRDLHKKAIDVMEGLHIVVEK